MESRMELRRSETPVAPGRSSMRLSWPARAPEALTGWAARNSCHATLTSASAVAIATPGLRRPRRNSHRSVGRPSNDRSRISSACIVMGTQKSVGVSTLVPENEGAVTPITVYGRPLTATCLPTMSESEAKRLLQ